MTAQQDDSGPDDVRYLMGVPWSDTELKGMGRRFIAAMTAAIRAGQERPPRIGIDRTPGTKKPHFVSGPR
jgi:hypothetical protein